MTYRLVCAKSENKAEVSNKFAKLSSGFVMAMQCKKKNMRIYIDHLDALLNVYHQLKAERFDSVAELLIGCVWAHHIKPFNAWIQNGILTVCFICNERSNIYFELYTPNFNA